MQDDFFPTHFESLYPKDARSEVLEKMLSYIKQGKSCQLVSLPGVGRANLFGFLSYNRAIRDAHLGVNQKWFHFITVNFSEIRKKPLVDVGKFLFLNLIDSLRERKLEAEYKKTSEIFREALSFHDELVLFQGLKQAIDILIVDKEFTVVFLIDRFEAYTSAITDDFFENLSVLRNRAKYRFSVVFALNRPLEETLEPAIFTDFADTLEGNTIYLPLLDKPSIDFRVSYLEKITERKLDEKIYHALLKLTGGHMKTTRLGAEALFATPQKVSLASLEQFLLPQKTIQGSFEEIWLSLTPSEHQYLLGNTHVERSTYLEDAGLVKDGELTIPLLKTFLADTKRRGELIKETGEKITLNVETNHITKGDVLLSDKLTASEFMLLAFLIQNGEKVVDRETIIANVWKDTKSLAGVTDQALDQLIFRLRKKIEDDPNKPTHLLTIKGRGFQLNA